MTILIDISLTTIPPRFSKIGKTLNSLLNQTTKIQNIWLNIPRNYKRFPKWDGVLPEVPNGIKIHRINEDLGPASKILPILNNPSAEEYILYCDDDWEYEPTWAETFVFHKGKKQSAIAASTFDVERLRKKNGVIAQGFGGVLIRKNFFLMADTIIDKSFTWVDDIWLSACLCKNRIKVLKNVEASTLYRCSISDKHELQNSSFNSMKRADLNKIASNRATEIFGIWK